MKLRLNYLEKMHNATSGVERAHPHENIIPTVKYGGGNLMIWACFAASEPELAIIEEKISSQVYQTILQDNVRMSVHQLETVEGG